MDPLMQAMVFLLDTVFTLYMVTALLRILLQWVRADFYNPVCQLVLKVTNPCVAPLRRLVPAYGGIDWASIVLLLLVAFLKQTLLIAVQTGALANVAGLFMLGLADSLSLLFYIYLFAVIALVVISWLNPRSYHPIVQIAEQLAGPGLNQIRRFLPDMSGFDLSPLVFTLLLFLFNILVVQMISVFAFTLLFS